jgi:hypothetical protein
MASAFPMYHKRLCKFLIKTSTNWYHGTKPNINSLDVEFTYLLLPMTEECVVFSGSANELSFKECSVENRCIIVDKLQEVDFQCEAVVKLGLSS